MVKNNSIIINSKEYIIGQKYRIFSPLNAPYLYVNPTNFENQQRLKNTLKNNNNAINYYVGRLVQIPRMKENGYIGNLMFFAMDDVIYGNGAYLQAEPIDMIRANITKIKEY